MICRLARLAWLILLFPATPHAADPVRVFAAVTLKPVLDMIAEEYRRRSGGDVLLAYGPSPALAKQIENGATADLFFSADKEWMDELAQHHLIKPETVIELVGNHLVMITRKGSEHRVTIAPGFPLAELVRHRSLGDVRPRQPSGGAIRQGEPCEPWLVAKRRGEDRAG